MDEKIAPDVRSYLDVQLYLQDVYKTRKAGVRGFSYDAWAKELGLSSKSYLRFTVLGRRRISPELTAKLVENLGFSEEEREYFTLLVLYTQCSESGQKQILGRKLTALLRANVAFASVVPSEEIFANPAMVILRNLLSFSDAPKNVAALAKIFSMNDDEMLSSLRKLENAGLIVEESSTWRVHQEWIRVEGRPNNQVLANYHRRSLEKAAAAQSLDPDCRNYRGLSFALNPIEYKSLLSDFNEFALRICSKYNSDQLRGRRIYQINFNAFPWTDEFAPVDVVPIENESQ